MFPLCMFKRFNCVKQVIFFYIFRGKSIWTFIKAEIILKIKDRNENTCCGCMEGGDVGGNFKTRFSFYFDSPQLPATFIPTRMHIKSTKKALQCTFIWSRHAVKLIKIIASVLLLAFFLISFFIWQFPSWHPWHKKNIMCISNRSHLWMQTFRHYIRHIKA